MINKIGIIGYKATSITDGDGVRAVLYIARCTHGCRNCHNQEYWNDNGDTHDIADVVDMLVNTVSPGITISGGDGLTVQYKATLELLKRLRQRTSKTIWLYTGYTYEELMASYKKEIFNYIDVLVDGRFEEDKRDVTLKFKGSSNQNIINIKESLKQNKKILYDI